MSSKLTPDEIFLHSEQHRQKAVQLIDLRGRLQAQLKELTDSGAPIADINEKKQEIQKTNSEISRETDMARDLDAKAMLDILVATDVADAISEIERANKRVEEAIDKINSIKKTFQYIDLFIRLGGAIVSAATTGSPAAQIKAIVEAIDTLYQADFSSN